MKDALDAVGTRVDEFWAGQLHRVRLILAVTAAYAAIGAVLLWQIRSTEAFVPWLWPLLWGIGAVASASCALRADRASFVVSLVGLACGHAGRCVAVILNVTNNTVKVSLTRATLGALLYAFLTAGIALVWLLLLEPVIWRAGRPPR